MTSSSAAPVLDLAARLRDRVDDAVAQTFTVTRSEASAGGEEGAVVVDTAQRSATGGKRLRALLCLAAELACRPGTTAHGRPGDTTGDAAVAAGAALELFQAAALVHDDLMDASDTRRGAPAAHRHLENVAHPGTGDALARERFGASAALLVGDLLLTMSATALHRAVAPLAPATSVSALETYSAMATEVAVGQYLDLLASHAPWDEDGDADLDRALRVIHAKTTRYSVELPLRLGGLLAGADETSLTWLSALGRDVGTAFQLRDDLLGVFGDPAVTGKPAGDDLREGKRTVLVALAYRAADESGRALLRRLLGNADLTDADIAALHEVLEGTGARADVERRIADLSAAAARTLAQPPAGVGDTALLAHLVEAAITRTS